MNQPGSTSSLTIDPRFGGPPNSANGGYGSGCLAELVDGPASVRLHAPVPVGRQLQRTVQADGSITLDDDGATVASATPATAPSPAPDPVSIDAARAAVPPPNWMSDHPFPGCFVCGPGRTPGDGLCVHVGPIDDGSTRWATVWEPRVDAGDGNLTDANGRASTRLVWSLLDCPSGIASAAPGEVVVLGTITATINEPPPLDEELLIVASADPPSGRKRPGHSAIFGLDGIEYARADALWITVPPSA